MSSQLPKFLIKRNGSSVVFDSSKIQIAITKAGLATSEFGGSIAYDLTHLVLSQLTPVDQTVQIEDIQDIVENTLIKANYIKTAKAYIIYREQHKKLRDTHSVLVNVDESINEYLDRSDWRVNANANQGYSLGGLILNSSGKMTANYWLTHVYSPEIGNAHRNGDFHIHDLDMMSGYTYFGKEKVIIKQDDLVSSISFEDLYYSCPESEMILDIEDDAYVKFPKNLFVLDYIKNGWTQVCRLITKSKRRDMYTLTSSNGLHVTVTDNHPIITERGEIETKDVQVGDKWFEVDVSKLIDTNLFDTPQPVTDWVTIDSIEKVEIEDTYIYDITTMSNTLIVNGIWSHNCAGWSLRMLLHEGLNGVPGKVEATPPKHMSSAVGQIVNFLGTLQNEWAGAQAFSSFDTYMAPYIRKDNMTYDQVYQCIQELIYNLNVPSRWGCVDTETEVLSVDGFKRYDELKEGDLIYSWEDGNLIVNPVNKVVIKSFKGQLHGYFGRNYEQVVTPEHRVLTYDHNSNNDRVRVSNDIFNVKTPYKLPVRFENDISNKDGFGTWGQGNLWQYSDDDTKDRLQHDALRAGFTSCTIELDGKTYVKLASSKKVTPTRRELIDYDGLVWCPSVNAGTAVFRRNNKVFISGQTQTPFTNLTFDMVCPDDLKEQIPIIGGEEMPFSYGDLQTEMDMINLAYIQIMTDGDAKGRIFTFPIPTYNITDEFNWDSPISDRLFEMTAKYGLPYFQNFLNSDLSPNMVRSMCCRLRLDMRELLKRGNGLFGSAEMTGCYDDQTEVLTSNGWKLFKDVDIIGDEIFSMNENTLEPSWEIASEYHEYDVNDELIHFSSPNVDLMVTKNHRQITRNHDRYEIRTAEDLAKLKTFDIPKNVPVTTINAPTEFVLPAMKSRSGNYTYDELHIDYHKWAAFMGIWLSEGYVRSVEYTEKNHQYSVMITQTKKHIKDEIRELLNTLPFHYIEMENSFQIDSKQLWSYLIQFGKQPDRFIPNDLKKQPANILEILWAWLMKGDGHIQKHHGAEYYWSCSKRLIDDIQEILMYCGSRSSIKLEEKAGESSGIIRGRKITARHNTYMLTRIKRRKCASIINSHTELVPYKGKVFCLTVPSGLLCVRRNDKICWSGNSLGVVTINCARLGYLHKNDEEGLYKALDHLLLLAKDSLETKRKVIQRHMDNGLYPFTRRYLGTLRNHFSTIGVNGMHEMIRNFSDDEHDITDEYGHEMARKMLVYIQNKISDFQEETGNLFNTEASPAESANHRFAREDRKRYPDIFQSGTTDAPYYTNSSQLPVEYTSDPFAALTHQETLQNLYSGGTSLHLYMGERIGSGESCKKLIKRSLEKFRVPYLTITPTFSICPKHGYIAGEHEFCPICDEELIQRKLKNQKGE